MVDAVPKVILDLKAQTLNKGDQELSNQVVNLETINLGKVDQMGDESCNTITIDEQKLNTNFNQNDSDNSKFG